MLEKKKRERGYLYIQCSILGPGFTWKKAIESNVEKICVAALINELYYIYIFLKKTQKKTNENGIFAQTLTHERSLKVVSFYSVLKQFYFRI